MTKPSGQPIGNDDCPWDEFDPQEYAAHNYGFLRYEDHELLKRIRDYFSEMMTGQPVPRGIDLGAGPNLYPSLAMLPFCEEITLAERGAANRRWLKEQITRPEGFDTSWDRFWEVLVVARPYSRISDPRAALRSRARVRYCDVFRFRQPRSWGIGTMFFVAESITARWGEFQKAARQFVRLLRVGAPFAAAFMRNSNGSTVGTYHFPAVAVDEPGVEQTLASVAEIDDIVQIRFDEKAPLRDEYEGMILALGRAC